MGWARANIMYDKAASPKPNSLQESLFIAVWRQRQEIEILNSGALILAQGESKDAREQSATMFQEALALCFPGGKDAKHMGSRDKQMLESMREFVGKTITFTAPEDSGYGQRVKSRLARALTKNKKRNHNGQGKWQLAK